ncbi:MAG TPA: hypothetical protein VMW50_00520 [Dehalococcoidia bacterium]|nr:hypothetical protein [Dehalococcoidia bacterium]
MSFTIQPNTAPADTKPQEPLVPGVQPASSSGFTITPDPGAVHDSSEYAPPVAEKPTTLGQKFQGAREVLAQQGSGLVAGAAGIAGEGAVALAHEIPDTVTKILPLPIRMAVESVKGLNAPDVKTAIQKRMTYQPKTQAGKDYAAYINNPESLLNPLTYVKKLGELGDYLKSLSDNPDTQAEIDVLYNAALARLPEVVGKPGLAEIGGIKVPVLKDSIAARGTKYLMRGSEDARSKMTQNISAFKRAGVTEPTLGQVSEGGITKSSGGGEKAVAQQAPQVEHRADLLAGRLTTARTPEEAGTAIQNAIEGTPDSEMLTPHKKTVESPLGTRTGGWMRDVNDREGALHKKWQGIVGEQSPVFLKSTLNKLKELTTPVPGAVSTTSGFMSKRLLDIRSRMMDDVGKAKSMPLDAVEKIRHDIGELTDPRLDAPLSSSQANALYGSMKQDIGDMVARKGDKAKNAYNQAFEYSRNKNEIVDKIMEPLRKSKTPEEAFKLAISGTPEGASKLRTLFNGDGKPGGVKGLNPAEQDVVKGVALRRLSDSDTGEFNPVAFKTNWLKMSDDAKDVLFGKKGTSNLRNNLETLHQVMMKTQSTKTTLYEMRNYAVEHDMAGGIAGVTALAGHHGTASVLLGFLSGGFVMGRLIQRPWFIKWLASASKKQPANIAPMLAVLQRQAAQQSQDDQDATSDYINSIKNFDPRGGQP